MRVLFTNHKHQDQCNDAAAGNRGQRNQPTDGRLIAGRGRGSLDLDREAALGGAGLKRNGHGVLADGQLLEHLGLDR